MKGYAIIGALVLLLSLGGVGDALAHAKLASSTPAAGAKLTKVPASVTLVFTEEVRANDSSFTVADAKGATVATGKLDLNDLDHKTLTAALKPGLGDGVYTVTWKTVTPDDGGVSEGAFSFGVNAAPGQQPTAAPEQPKSTAVATAKATLVAATPTVAALTGSAAPPTTLPATGGARDTRFFWLMLAACAFVVGSVFVRRIAARR